MATLHLLGTGAAYSGAGRTTTMLCASDDASTLVIDCGGDAVARMQVVGVAVDTVRALFLTHEHIDHVGGFPLFYKKLWLAGRRDPLPVHGLPSAVVQAARCFESFDTRAFEGLPPVEWHALSPAPGKAVYSDDAWVVHAARGVHAVPVVGLRITSLKTGGTFVYSSDTSPCEDVVELARGCSLLLHEATGALPGHSTMEQAAEVARRAGVERLVLVHLPPIIDHQAFASAQEQFPATELGKEGGRYSF